MLEDQADDTALFTNRFNFQEEKVNYLHVEGILHLEIIDLKCNSALKSRFAELHVISTANGMILCWHLLQ